ncbi:MAG: DUF6884 domain-containing protein [Actinomycetota bacterium]
MRVILVGCGKRKLPRTAPAKNLYISPAFANRRKIAQFEGDRWFILSGLHGLVEPERVIEPYEKDLNQAGRSERRAWAQSVLDQMATIYGDRLDGILFELLAGNAYCGFGLRDGLIARGAKVEWPVQGKSQGDQGSYYARRAAGESGSEAEPRKSSKKTVSPTYRPRKSSDKAVSPTYRPLFDYLVSHPETHVRMSFGEIEKLLGRPLPSSARQYQAWWSGLVRTAIEAAGRKATALDLTKETVTFILIGGRPQVEASDESKVAEQAAYIPSFTQELVQQAVEALTDPASAESAATFPSRGQKVGLPGLYSWWADEEGRRAIGEQLPADLPPLIYAGQAGAGTGADLKQRVLDTHIGGQINRSTFRLTLASLLTEQLGLELLGPEKMSPQSEERLTAWIKQHLSVAVFSYEDRPSLRAFEEQVIRQIDAPLNLAKMVRGDVRNQLTKLRGVIRKGIGAS